MHWYAPPRPVGWRPTVTCWHYKQILQLCCERSVLVLSLSTMFWRHYLLNSVRILRRVCTFSTSPVRFSEWVEAQPVFASQEVSINYPTGTRHSAAHNTYSVTVKNVLQGYLTCTVRSCLWSLSQWFDSSTPPSPSPLSHRASVGWLHSSKLFRTVVISTTSPSSCFSSCMPVRTVIKLKKESKLAYPLKSGMALINVIVIIQTFIMICLKLLSDNKRFAQCCGFQVSPLTPYKDTVNVSMTNSTGGSSTASGYVWMRLHQRGENHFYQRKCAT